MWLVQRVYFYDDIQPYPDSDAMLGRCLGPARNEGKEIAQWILKGNMRVIIQKTIRKLTARKLSPSNEVEDVKRSS